MQFSSAREVDGERETFEWLFRVHLPRLLPQAAIAWHILEHHRPALVISPESAAAVIDAPLENNRFPYAPAIAIGSLIAAIGL